MLKNIKSFTRLTFYEQLLLLFPIVLILRSTVINIFFILIIFIFIYELFKKNYLSILKYETWVYFFLLFIFYSICRGFFATDKMLAITSAISLVKFLTFSLFIFLCIFNIKNLNFIIKFWTAILVILCIDTLIQFFFGRDIIGFEKSNLRLTGPFGSRQVIGAYLSYISIPLLFYYFSKIKNFNLNKNYLLFSFYFLLFITISLTGERLALITFLSSSIVIFFIFFRIKIFFCLLILIFSILFSIYYFSPSFNVRTTHFFLTIKDFPNSAWGRLYQSGYLVFKSDFFFGVGLKNYRIICDTQIVDPLKNSQYNVSQFCSTHPHHLYLEILSESGIIGFLLLFSTFVTFFSSIFNKIKKLKNNKMYQEYKGLLYGNILILFIYFWPIKTSGRFFTTWNGSFFWFNLGIALLITKDFYYKNK
jgi:O-antigen ligase